MSDWLILDGGKHWVLCKATVSVFGLATAVTHDGQYVSGRARRGIYNNWLIEIATSLQ